jgi:hypothetical protein
MAVAPSLLIPTKWLQIPVITMTFKMASSDVHGYILRILTELNTIMDFPFSTYLTNKK